MVSELKVGETAHALYHAMMVTETGDCYLDPVGTIARAIGPHTITVERRMDGYHVTVTSKGTSWRPTRASVSSAISVISISEEYNPELDTETKMARQLELAEKATRINE